MLTTIQVEAPLFEMADRIIFFDTLNIVIAFFFIELVLLFLLSRRLTSELSFLFYNIFKSQKIAVWLMAFVFLPGTIIHEFSHALMAHLLFVHVGKMELMPQMDGNNLKLGSVQVGRVDIIRNFFIGIAPFLVGTTLLLLLLYYSFSYNLLGFNLLTVGILYALFVIANTMYSSRKDMEGAIEFFALTLLPIAFLYFLGVRIQGFDAKEIISQTDLFFRTAVVYMCVPIILDVALILFAKIVRK